MISIAAVGAGVVVSFPVVLFLGTKVGVPLIPKGVKGLAFTVGAVFGFVRDRNMQVYGGFVRLIKSNTGTAAALATTAVVKKSLDGTPKTPTATPSVLRNEQQNESSSVPTNTTDIAPTNNHLYELAELELVLQTERDENIHVDEFLHDVIWLLHFNWFL